MVEAPGTAPGSEWFITKAVYRHIRLAPAPQYISRSGGKKKVHDLGMTGGDKRGVPLTRQTQSLRLIFTISPLKASTFISILWPPASRLDLPDIVVELNLLDGCEPLSRAM